MARRELGPAGFEVARAVRDALAGVRTQTMIIGVSGGADSMALAAAVAWEQRRRDRAGEPALHGRAVVVDHGIQPGSAEVADAVAGRVQQLGLGSEVLRVRIAADAPGGPEAAAREARYAALRRAAGGGVIVVGHTLDDQAETVLLGLARGSGSRSLAGMAPRSGDLLRPLLTVRRAITRQACREWGIEVWEDPHNESDDYTRVRVRKHVLPIVESQLGPGVAESLARTAVLARADAEALEQWAARELAVARSGATEAGSPLDCAHLATLPTAVLGRVLKGWLEESGGRDLTSDHVRAVAALVTAWRGQGAVAIPGGEVVRREGRLHATARNL